MGGVKRTVDIGECLSAFALVSRLTMLIVQLGGRLWRQGEMGCATYAGEYLDTDSVAAVPGVGKHFIMLGCILSLMT